MGAPPLVRQSPAAGARSHVGEPATVAFRRPSDDFSTAGAASGEQRWDVPVLLRLPDLNAPAISPAAGRTGSGNPLVGKLMWAATGVLAIVAVWLVASGNPNKPAALPAAPSWNKSAGPAAGTAPPTDSSTLHPVPNWKSPNDTGYGSQADPANNRGPWRAGAQVIQPGAAAEVEPGAADKPVPPGSASWPGDAWPGQPAEANGNQEPAVITPQIDNSRDLLPNSSPPAAPSAPPADPWPGAPQWPDDARNAGAANSAPVRTATRPAPPATGPLQRQPEARLQGGIQNMDVSPSYDGTRSSIH
jgi:hypothetical protein